MPDCADVKPLEVTGTITSVLADAATDLVEAIATTRPSTITSSVVRVGPVISPVDQQTQPGASDSRGDVLNDTPGRGSLLSQQITAWAAFLRDLVPTNIWIVTEPKSPDRIFFTNVVNFQDGTLAEHRNAMILPFFPHAPKDTNNETKGAYQAGRDRTYETTFVAIKDGDETGAAEHRDYMEVIVDSIHEQLVNGEDIAIDVMGFASAPWKHAKDEEHRKDLNHALAEGRRAAVLNTLTRLLRGETRSGQIWLIGLQGESCFGELVEPRNPDRRKQTFCKL